MEIQRDLKFRLLTRIQKKLRERKLEANILIQTDTGRTIFDRYGIMSLRIKLKGKRDFIGM